MSTYEKGKAEAGKADQRDGDEVEAIDGNMVERRLVMPLMDSASKPTKPVCTEFASAVRLRQPRYKILSQTDRLLSVKGFALVASTATWLCPTLPLLIG